MRKGQSIICRQLLTDHVMGSQLSNDNGFYSMLFTRFLQFNRMKVLLRVTRKKSNATTQLNETGTTTQNQKRVPMRKKRKTKVILTRKKVRVRTTKIGKAEAALQRAARRASHRKKKTKNKPRNKKRIVCKRLFWIMLKIT